MSNKTTFFLLVAVCATTSATTQLLPPPRFPTPFQPFPEQPGSPVDVTKCWSSIMNIQGCVAEIYQSVFSGQFMNVAPACCQAYLAVDADCWPKMFPFNPFFPPALKAYCSRNAGKVPSASM